MNLFVLSVGLLSYCAHESREHKLLEEGVDERISSVLQIIPQIP